MEKLTEKDLLNALQFKSNAKMEMYIGNSKWSYQHISIREETKSLPTRNDVYEILLIIENMVIFRRQIYVVKWPLKTIDDMFLTQLKQYHDKPEIPIPRWLNGLLSSCYKYGYFDVGATIMNMMNCGKMTKRELEVLYRMYKKICFDNLV